MSVASILYDIGQRDLNSGKESKDESKEDK